MCFNKLFKFVILIILLTFFAIFSGCGGCGGENLVTPPLPVETDDSEIPESTEAISQEIDLSIGGEVEVTDPESIIYGVKLIIPPIPSEKRRGKSTATMTISYIDNPYSLELPDNRGFLLPPVVINSDVTLDYECILEIPYTEADLNNMGLSSNENIKIYHYNYYSSSWEEVTINERSYKDKINLDYMGEEKVINRLYPPFGLDWTPVKDTDFIYICSYPRVPPPFDLGFPQPGDLLYKLSEYKVNEGWIPGHVGIYVGEFEKDNKGEPYNVIEARLFGGVQRNYYNPISDFSGNATYMGANQPKEFGPLTSVQRKYIVNYIENLVGLPYACGQSIGVLFGMLRGDLVKGDYGTFNCVGLAEAAYELPLINGGEGLVSDKDEGNTCLSIYHYSFPSCVLTPAEQYAKTEPAEGYTVSGRVTDFWGNGISDVTLNFELVSFYKNESNDNYYTDSFDEVKTDSEGKWSNSESYNHKRLGREWNVTPQKDGYTFEPSTIKVKEDANDIDFTSTSEPEILTPEEIELIRKWGYGGDYVVRWPDGFVGVYDETNYSLMQDVINEWNDAINGPVKFYLSSNPNSPVKVIFDSSLGLENLCGSSNKIWGDDYAFSEITIRVNPSESCCGSYNIKYCLYLHMFNAVVGFNCWAEVEPCPFETWSNFNTIPDTIKTMLRALHKVPPGYYLGDTKQRKDRSNSVMKNIFTSGGGNCLDE